MRYTLLELTQSILRSMESDEVSSISETQEASDVVDIIKECYFDIVGQNNLKEHEGVFKLDASGDNLKPTLMIVPSQVARVDSLRYNIGDLANPDWKPLYYVDNDEFLFYQSGLDADESTVSTMTVPINSTNLVLKFENNRFPAVYTIFDETLVVFDAVDLVEETTLTQVRSLGHGLIIPIFTRTNAFIPDLDPRQFQLLLQDAKATAHVELKQAVNPKAEQKYRRNQILAQKTRNDNAKKDSSQRRKTYGRK